MKMSRSDKFWEFLIKEKELEYIMSLYVQKSQKCMDKAVNNLKKSNNIFDVLKKGKKYFKHKYNLKKQKSSNLKEYDNIIEHKEYKNGELKNYIILSKCFISDSLKQIKKPKKVGFRVYIKIELIDEKIFTKKYFCKNFKTYKKAYNYFCDLQLKVKNTDSVKIIEYLTLEIDNDYKNVKNLIDKINIKY